MKFAKDNAGSGYAIRAYAPGAITVSLPPATEEAELEARAANVLTRSFIISPAELIVDWAPTHLDELAAEHLQPVVQMAPQVVLIGSGERQRFPQAQVLQPLIAAGVGIEVMDNGAACRTYNILAAEGRAVVAALLLGESPQKSPVTKR